MAQCPICESSKLSVLIKNNSFQVIVCKNCHIAFTSPQLVLPDYENMDFHSKNDIANTEKLTFYNDLPFDWKKLIDLQVRLVSKHLSPNAAILEIGCGEGILLDSLINKGFVDVEGFEPSYTAAKRAQKRGISVHNGYFEPSLANRKFNLVIMSHVLEHIEQPLQLLDGISAILKPGGSLLLTQTNYKGLIPTIQKASWYAWVPDQHFWHFTPQSLKYIFSKLNFTVVELEYQSLVHPHNRLYKIAKFIPYLQDQFIIMAKSNK